MLKQQAAHMSLPGLSGYVFGQGNNTEKACISNNQCTTFTPRKGIHTHWILHMHAGRLVTIKTDRSQREVRKVASGCMVFQQLVSLRRRMQNRAIPEQQTKRGSRCQPQHP